MLKHDAGRVLHSERCGDVEQIQRSVGSPGQLFRKIFGQNRKLSTVAAPTAATTAHCKYDGKGKRRISAN